MKAAALARLPGGALARLLGHLLSGLLFGQLADFRFAHRRHQRIALGRKIAGGQLRGQPVQSTNAYST